MVHSPGNPVGDRGRVAPVGSSFQGWHLRGLLPRECLSERRNTRMRTLQGALLVAVLCAGAVWLGWQQSQSDRSVPPRHAAAGGITGFANDRDSAAVSRGLAQAQENSDGMASSTPAVLWVADRDEQAPICPYCRSLVAMHSVACSRCTRSFRWESTSCRRCDGSGKVTCLSKVSKVFAISQQSEERL